MVKLYATAQSLQVVPSKAPQDKDLNDFVTKLKQLERRNSSLEKPKNHNVLHENSDNTARVRNNSFNSKPPPSSAELLKIPELKNRDVSYNSTVAAVALTTTDGVVDNETSGGFDFATCDGIMHILSGGCLCSTNDEQPTSLEHRQDDETKGGSANSCYVPEVPGAVVVQDPKYGALGTSDSFQAAQGGNNKLNFPHGRSISLLTEDTLGNVNYKSLGSSFNMMAQTTRNRRSPASVTSRGSRGSGVFSLDAGDEIPIEDGLTYIVASAGKNQKIKKRRKPLHQRIWHRINGNGKGNLKKGGGFHVVDVNQRATDVPIVDDGSSLKSGSTTRMGGDIVSFQNVKKDEDKKGNVVMLVDPSKNKTKKTKSKKSSRSRGKSIEREQHRNYSQSSRELKQKVAETMAAAAEKAKIANKKIMEKLVAVPVGNPAADTDEPDIAEVEQEQDDVEEVKSEEQPNVQEELDENRDEDCTVGLASGTMEVLKEVIAESSRTKPDEVDETLNQKQKNDQKSRASSSRSRKFGERSLKFLKRKTQDSYYTDDDYDDDMDDDESFSEYVSRRTSGDDEDSYDYEDITEDNTTLTSAMEDESEFYESEYGEDDFTVEAFSTKKYKGRWM